MANSYSEDLYGSETYSQQTTDTAAGGAAYNEILYNEYLYNAAILVLALFETLTASDVKRNDDSILKTEIITVVDQLQRFFNGAIFAESILPTAVLLNKPQLVKLETMFMGDFLTFSVLRTLLETMTLSDVRTMVQAKPLSDFIVLVDDLTKQITDKRLPMDNIRLNDWLEIRNSPQSDPWN